MLPVRARPEAAALDVEELRRAAVGVELHRAQAGVAVGRAEDERARAVAEEDGERAVLVGARSRCSGVAVLPLAGSSASQSSHGMKPAWASAPTKRIVRAAPLLIEPVDDLQPEEHRRALLADVERGDAVEPELVRRASAPEPGKT